MRATIGDSLMLWNDRPDRSHALRMLFHFSASCLGLFKKPPNNNPKKKKKKRKYGKFWEKLLTCALLGNNSQPTNGQSNRIHSNCTFKPNKKAPIKYRDLARLISDIVTWPNSTNQQFPKASQVKKVADYIENIQFCDPASDKVITQERSLSIRKFTNRYQGDKGMK